MDKEDKRRYFIVGSIYLEVVTPLFQQKLEQKYVGLNFRCLKDFLDRKAVIHILFHLRHRNAWCCIDKGNCTNRGALPLNHHQWKQLYAENPGPGIHNCFCKYTAKSVKPADLDLSLCGLILYNCCNLGQLDEEAVHILRRNKNDFLSHNTTCGITKDEYGPLIDELKTNILQLDHTKEDELAIIQRRPLDDALCNKYMTTLLDIHEILEKIDTKIDSSTNQILETVNMNNAGLTAKIEEFMQRVVCQNCRGKFDKQEIKDQPVKHYQLGQPIFTLHHQTDLTSKFGDRGGYVSDIVMMDDGRLVMCLPLQTRLLICNTHGSQVDSIHVLGNPYYVTAVNNSTVAVTLYDSKCIEMYDIHNKLKLKSISSPGMWCWSGITTINNKLVVGADNTLLIIDHQTGEVVQTIKTDCDPWRLHGSGDRIFYCSWYNPKLYWYSYTDDRHHTLTLPSPPISMTTLQDGSLYVRCEDGSVQHVSYDGKQYKTVTTKGLQKCTYSFVSYNSKQKELIINHERNNKCIFKVFYEK
ncbi:uncharacterized protein LOC143085035 isoform X3 [Mytilus galloprovincialis]|uniref:uncharacterized protein LOC143085035 isoform X3 n=1 Tax=Mytilus galloprovincialis TaxID=29158 RepID=UPI003F7B3C62